METPTFGLGVAMKIKIKEILKAVWIGMALLACQTRFHFNIRPDGTGMASGEIEFRQEEKVTMEGLGISSCRALLTQSSSRLASANVQIEDRWSQRLCRFNIPFRNLDELRSSMKSLMGAEISKLSLDSVRKRFEIQASIELPDESSGIERVELLMDLPGTPLETNAHERQGRRLIWRWDLAQNRSLYGKSVEIRATSSVGGSDIPVGVLVLIPILGGGAAAAALVLRRGGLAQLRTAMASAQRFCSYCGSPLPPGARFCGRCGRPTRAS